MAPKNVKRGLGKGLDSIIPASTKVEKSKTAVKTARSVKEEVVLEEGQVVKINITKIEPNREQPRKNFDEDAILELSDSIKQYGILSPLVVQDRKDHYEIIAGERRWRAAKKAGLKEVPAIIKNYTEQEIVEISLIENIQREDLNPIEEAQAYKRLLTEFNLKQDEVAARVSKSRVAVTNSMRLLKLCDEVQQMVIEGKISTGHARALISIENPEKQYEIAQKIFDEKLSVRETEKLVKNLDKIPKTPKLVAKNESLETAYRQLEEKLKSKIGTKVQISSSAKGDGSGKIEIEFYNTDDLEKIADKLSV
ncbi:MAG: ParB/RepB/Spo0J family partition protein [Butyrivibrio sp.]|jgi:ParB family chromosome partitioning protein|nr:ParB/RepB/Spo0J family partition protein [Butyrivibrio sp.]